jgi:hypothetical protein
MSAQLPPQQNLPPAPRANVGAPSAAGAAAQAQTTVVKGKTLAELTALARQRAFSVFLNLGLQVVPAQIDHDRGVVFFNNPVGHIQGVITSEDGAPIRDIYAKASGTLRYPPRVKLTFAYTDSPRAREALRALGKTGGRQGLAAPQRGDGEVIYNYTFLAGRDKDGNVVQLNPGLVEPKTAPTLFPLIVENNSLRLFVSIDGTSNQAELDAKALELAKNLLTGPENVSGEDGEANVFVPMNPSCRVPSVSWEFGPGMAKTRWTINNAGASKKNLGARITQGGGGV